MQVDFLGHAAFLFTSAAGTRVMTDPYEAGGFSGRVGYAQIDKQPDLIVITHDHLDHSHTATIPGPFEVIRHQGVFKDISVRSVSAFHDEFEGKKFGGSIDMKIFTIDGVRICHCGDLGERLLDPVKREEIGPIDILIVPTGGFYTLGPEGALEVSRRLAPRVVIPCHYKTASCGFDIAPLDPFLDAFEQRLRLPFEGSTTTLDPSLLPSHPAEGELPHCLPLSMRYDLGAA